MSVLLSCDAGGEQMPAVLEAALQAAGVSLPGDTGWEVDRAAMWATRMIAGASGQPAVINPFRGDLIDVRRGPGRRGWLAPPLRSAITANEQGDAITEAIVAGVQQPYRARLGRAVSQAIATFGTVTHLSIRTHDARTSRGDWVRGDVGIAYDTGRPVEAEVALDLVDALAHDAAHLKVRRNYPLRGTAAGTTRWLRRQHRADQYVGLELTLNRAWAGRSIARRETTLVAIGRAVAAIAELPVAMVA